jgi:hypothetical protein
MLLFAGCARYQSTQLAESAYAPSGDCGKCHAEIADRYRHVAMARSLYRPTPATSSKTTGGTISSHAASGNHYRMVERQAAFTSSASSVTNAP